jgi:phenylacetate-coenzyme A ligase PaaK-like adenylate-forming protein
MSWESYRDSVTATVVARSDEHIERLAWSADRIAEEQRDGLRALLASAMARSPFHTRRLGAVGVDPETFEVADLGALPVMTKAEMMASFDDVTTDRRLRRADVEAALAATGPLPVPIDGEYIAIASGGSSGQRGIFVLDRHAIASFILTISRGILARLQPFGGPPPGGLPIAIVAAASAVHATGSTTAFAAAPNSPFRFHSVPATLPLAVIVDRLNRLRAPVLLGYASMLARLAAEQRGGRLQLVLAGVSSTSEHLSETVRA